MSERTVQEQSAPGRWRPALYEGLRFGVGLGIIEVIGLILENYLPATVGTLLYYLSLLLAALAFLFASIRASRRTGYTTTGLLAAILAGLVSALLLGIGALLYAYAATDWLRSMYQAYANSVHLRHTYTNADVIAIALSTGELALIFSLLASVCIGALGSFIGRRQYAR